MLNHASYLLDQVSALSSPYFRHTSQRGCRFRDAHHVAQESIQPLLSP
jgi:hypothetical protein